MRVVTHLNRAASWHACGSGHLAGFTVQKQKGFGAGSWADTDMFMAPPFPLEGLVARIDHTIPTCTIGQEAGWRVEVRIISLTSIRT